MNRIAVTIKGRTVYWDIEESAAAHVLSLLVQSLGPAQEDQ